ncbi:amidohydrolase [Amycolatopsis sp. GM8]|uniref:amidohydrolase n=1 Tax=Amycolatopsis sp. GM8 TaxID=2896530 RepID=UPI001F0232BD|nr:amidohydrolase [Amycolatopsis sp. GM8]
MTTTPIETPHYDVSPALHDQLVAWRRDFHTYAEPGWTEFRTTARIITELRAAGLEVIFGPDVCQDDERMGVPGPAALARERERAVAQGGDPGLIAAMGEGFTGAIALLDTGRPGPTIAYRVDIDSNDLIESTSREHRPAREGFASVNPGAMHGCGHDGHAAIGLGLARALVENKDALSGRIKIIFQPAEEGVRGAHSIVAAGHLDDVDVFVATHVGAGVPHAEVACGGHGYLATTKFDIRFTGVGAHAGSGPELGRNALLAAAAAATNLHAIPRHSGGDSRVNVGTLTAGEGRNVIAREAFLRAETRGRTSEVNDEMFARARSVIEGAARMHDVDHSLTIVGASGDCDPSEDLLPFLHEQFAKIPAVQRIQTHHRSGGSDDATAMMRRVKERGGLASYVFLGMNLPSGHHTPTFDIEEDTLDTGVALLANVALNATSIGR